MARGKKHTAEQIVNTLRQVEVGIANEKTLPQACKEAEIVEQIHPKYVILSNDDILFLPLDNESASRRINIQEM